jgi:hypothetical protein
LQEPEDSSLFEYADLERTLLLHEKIESGLECASQRRSFRIEENIDDYSIGDGTMKPREAITEPFALKCFTKACGPMESPLDGCIR